MTDDRARRRRRTITAVVVVLLLLLALSLEERGRRRGGDARPAPAVASASAGTTGSAIAVADTATAIVTTAAVAPSPAPAPTRVAVARPTSTPRSTRHHPKKPPRGTRTPRIAIPLAAFRVSDVTVETEGYVARVRGFVSMNRPGALAQPLLAWTLTDAYGRTLHEGTLTPAGSTGPLWVGDSRGGLARVAFETSVDLARASPGKVPPGPYAARVRVIRVVDSKKAKRSR